jgi:hypothetical protein
MEEKEPRLINIWETFLFLSILQREREKKRKRESLLTRRSQVSQSTENLTLSHILRDSLAFL